MKTKTNWLLSLVVFCALTCFTTRAATLYVWQGSPNPTPPFTNWATAAHTIQQAVDAAVAGDGIVVTNGVYVAVSVNKQITLTSVSGAPTTVVDGGGTNRCVWLGTNAVLSGFTLTNGYAGYGGGVWCDSTNALVTNCTLTGNWAYLYGGGASGGTLNNCTLTGNSATNGGGAYQSTLNNCTLTGNSASRDYGHGGGGAYYGTLNKCILTGNSGRDGGGAAGATLNNCTLTGNSASWNGGGASGGRLNNCTLIGNSAYDLGGGAFLATLNNCTLTGNSAAYGGGAAAGRLNNCIVYYNVANTYPNYYDYYGSNLNYCCTTPLPTEGIGNITNEPAFVSLAGGDFHLRYGSPCIDAGINLSAIITNDLDGHPHPLDGNGDGIAAFDMGAYECVPLVHYVWQDSPNPASPFTDWATAAHTIQDAVDAAPAGDMVLVVGGVYDTGGRAVFGSMTNRVAIDKAIRVESLMGPEVTVIEGHQLPGTTNGDGAIRCVYLANGAVLYGFTLTNGATRTGVDSVTETTGGGVLCESTSAAVSNCVLTGNSAYVGGGAFGGPLTGCTLTGNSAEGSGGGVAYGTLNNCTLSDNSASGGGGAFQSSLNNCTLTSNLAIGGFAAGGGTSWSTLGHCILTGNSAIGNWAAGGGAFEGTLDNCTVTGNSARIGGGAAESTLNNCALTSNWGTETGGGVQHSTLTNCILTDNSARWGGGAFEGTLDNCTLTGNSAGWGGGGSSYSWLLNCVAYFNTATVSPNFDSYSTLNFCCTTPLPPSGTGNMTNEPAFVDRPNGNLRLQSDSPCINAGNNAYTTNTTTDLDGNPRIVSGTVDIGAYEYQGAGSVISYAWLQQYGLPTDGSADLTDPDLDGQNNWQEWQADTNPTNAASVLRLTILSNSPAVAVTFSSSAARLYRLLCCTNLTGSPASSVWTDVPGQTDLPGTGDVLTLTDTNPPAPAFYRVSVRFP